MRILEFNLGGWEVFWLCFYGFATYGNAGYLREQVCKYMCPYARFQSAMFDDNSLVISYDVARGEPRGGRRRDADYKAMGLGDCIDCKACVQVCPTGIDIRDGLQIECDADYKAMGLGDCIDCKACVQVCPTGIDIRDGLQIECIACAACIDVCDDVMDKMGYPPGLVRYTTENALQGKPSRILRPRIFIYLFVLLALMALVGSILTGRDALIADVLRDRTSLYRVIGSDLENSYRLKLSNRTEQPLEINLSASGLEGLRVVEPQDTFSVQPGQADDFALTLALPLNATEPGMRPVTVTASSPAGETYKVIETRFFVPADPQ